MNPCPICGTETGYDQQADPDPEIEVEVRAALHVAPGMRKVLLWRRRILVELGYVEPMLELLTESPVDLRGLQSLLEAGCPLQTAAEILL